MLRRARRRALACKDDASDEGTWEVQPPPDGVRGIGDGQAGVEDHRPDAAGEPRGVRLFVHRAVRAADVVDLVVAEGLPHRLDVQRDVARAVAVGVVSEGPAASTDAAAKIIHAVPAVLHVRTDDGARSSRTPLIDQHEVADVIERR